MKRRLLSLLIALPGCLSLAAQGTADGYKLVWQDEFNVDGRLNPADWTCEHGFMRNEEAQWYQEDNAFCQDGMLIIEGRREHFRNPEHGRQRGWRNREYVDYTAASVTTNGRHAWTYGRFEICARIPAYTGCWPAIWMLGQNDSGRYGWPHNGEIDIMEFYQVKNLPHILANACWGSSRGRYDAEWNTRRVPLTHFTDRDPNWPLKFHVWRMDWTEESISLYLDDELLNRISLSETVNAQTEHFPEADYNPFHHPQYLLLNLALGGQNGGSLADTPFPCRYEIDYVRVYSKP